MLGIDVVDVRRLGSALSSSPRLSRRLFSQAELSHSSQKSDPSQHLAGTLAAKEAVAKALRIPLPPNVRRIEILRDAAGVPTARVSGHRERFGVSIAHDGGVAVAVALPIGVDA